MNFLQQYDDQCLDKINRLFNQIERGAYTLPRESLDALTSVPLKAGVNKGALTFTYKLLSELGVAKVIASNAKDLPAVSRAYKLKTVVIKDVGDSYCFTQDEIDSYLFAGGSIEADDANTARRKIDEKVDEIIFIGEADNEILGLLNNPNVTVATANPVGDENVTAWKSKTLDQIKDDIQIALDAIFNATKGPRGGETVRPDTIKIPRDAYISLTNRYKSEHSDVTYLQALKALFEPQGLMNWELCNSANNAGEDGESRALFYKKSMENVFSIVPVAFRVLPPQYEGLCVTYNCLAKTAGTVWRRPTTGCYMDGV